MVQGQRGGLLFQMGLKQSNVNTTRKSMCISVCGVKIWNGLTEEVKHSTNITQFKKQMKHTILAKYSIN